MRDLHRHLLLPALLVPILCIAATPVPASQTIVLDGRAGGPRFDGIGVVDGGGATSVLLKDYPEPMRGKLLDLLYKPHFGASVSTLIAEIPGDGNSTQGSMPSHMHTRDDLNDWRGYTWWVLREAKRRNPLLSLDGAAWSAPGWIGADGDRFAAAPDPRAKGDPRFFSRDATTYYVKWLAGLRQAHDLEFDALGIRNEKGVNYGFAKALRAALDDADFAAVKLHAFDNWPDAWKFDFVRDLDSDPALRDAIGIISAHINAPKSVVPAAVRRAAHAMGKPIWNTEQHVYEPGYDALIGIVQAFNENFIRSGITKIVDWYGIAGLYDMEPYSGVKEAALRANWPWSGHAEINPSLWGYAHYGQFSAVGWTYLGGASGDLASGGTFVTLVAPSKDYSVILETKNATAPQDVAFAVGGGLSGRPLAVWRSDAQSYFLRQPDLTPVAGAFHLTLEPGAVYSVTTTRGQTKGSLGDVPAPGNFPLPYRETFDSYGDPRAWGYLPRYFADIAGAFELADCPGGRGGGCLHQAVPTAPLSWAPDWQPYTIIGDAGWRDYEVSADVYLGPGQRAAVMGRINSVGTGYGFIPKGYLLQLDGEGELRLVVVRGKKDKKALVGDAEQQALIKAANDAGEGGEKLLASARLAAVAPGQWHRLKLRFDGAALTGFVDGTAVLNVDDATYASGMAGLLAGAADGHYDTPWFDDVLIDHAGASGTVAPTAPLAGQRPLYVDLPSRK